MPDNDDVDLVKYIHKLRRSVRALMIVGGLTFLLGGVALIRGYTTNNARIDDNQEALVALCSLKQDLIQRVDNSNRFLKDHPQGILGIPLRVIQDQLRNQQSTVESLSSLKC